MKAFTHPKIVKTQIRFKDISSYNKYWIYLRPSLLLEETGKVWEKKYYKVFINAPLLEDSINHDINFWNKLDVYLYSTFYL